MKPVVTHKAGVALSCLLFSKHSPVVVCGGEDGVVRCVSVLTTAREVALCPWADRSDGKLCIE